MIVDGWPKRGMIVGFLTGMALVAAAYVFTAGRLSEARHARRDDDCSLAERCLAACWRLPGLRSAITLEEQLLAVQQGDMRDEQAWQTRATERSMNGRLILEALAKGNLATFQWKEAQNCAESMLDRQPADARALWLRGRARGPMQNEELARHDFEQALEIEADAFEIRRSLADLLHQLGYVREAIEHYQQLLERRPNNHRVILALAYCWQEEARPDEARQLVDSLLARQPDSVAGLVERGRLALRTSDLASAERWLRRAIELSPDHTDANAVLRLALHAQQKDDIALDRRIDHNDRRQAELKFRLQESEHKPALLTDVGRWMMRTGHEDEAAGWFYAALKADSDYAPAHLGLQEFFSQCGQTRRASWHARLGGSELNQSQKRQSSSEVVQPNIGPRLSGARLSQDLPVDEAPHDGVHRLCAACHAYPPPETMPRSAWRKEVKQGYEFLRSSALAGDFPPLENVVRYYERRALERLPLIEQPKANVTAPVKFEKRGTGWIPNVPPQPGIANANLTRLFGSAKQELLLCDTQLDAVLVLKPYAAGPGGAVLRGVTAPCHTAVCDLDRDGLQDMLVASLGNFFPTDDKVGKVLWLRAAAGGQFEAKPLLEGVGRVSDVQVADFNSDGRLDLVVAVFGWRTAGEILYLENQTTDWSQPQFRSHVVDSRHGAIHVPVVDLNRDGRPDFVALISQEHEAIVAYLNQGAGAFRQETIFAAAHPTFGCSGIEVVDLDGDRDLDVLLTNGDILDRPYVLKPYHGVQWLENTGTFPYKHHQLAAMYGAARAVAADFDGDGDQDVAAVSFLPKLHFPEREKLQLPSVVLFEQTAKAQFAMHILENGTCDHFSCDAGDWDDDGLVDLAVANFSWNGSQPIGDAATLWWNTGRQ